MVLLLFTLIEKLNTALQMVTINIDSVIIFLVRGGKINCPFRRGK